MHFCVLTTRFHAARCWPRKYGLNWFMPAFVNSSVGSSCGTTGELGTNVCPCRCTKKSMNCRRISSDVMGSASNRMPCDAAIIEKDCRRSSVRRASKQNVPGQCLTRDVEDPDGYIICSGGQAAAG